MGTRVGGAKRWFDLVLRFGREGRAGQSALDSVEPPLPEDDQHARSLIQFLTDLGRAMASAEDATTFIRRALEKVGRAYGLAGLRVSIGPTLLLLRLARPAGAVVELTTISPVGLRLDQVSDTYRLLDEAKRAKVEPDSGSERLSEILARKPRFNSLISVAGLGLLSAGLSLILEPSASVLLVCALLGGLVGVVKLVTARWPALSPLVPVLSAGGVGAAGLLLLDMGLKVTASGVMIPPLAIFLPGAATTVAMIELSAGDYVSGGSRLAFAATRFLLLVFGLVIAAQAIHVDEPPVTYNAPPVAPLVSLLGVAAFTAGVYLHCEAPRGSLPWLFIVVLLAWAAQRASAPLLGSYLSAGLGGGVMVVVAAAVEGRSGAPPLIVSYTPAFWFLVPGSIGLRSLAELAREDAPAALSHLFVMLLTMLAIALGMLIGLLIARNQQMYDSD